MKSQRHKIALGLGALVLSALACNYPGTSEPTPFAFETPNATLTAVFQPTSALPGALASATSALLPTLAVPTAAPPTAIPITPIPATAVPPTAIPNVPITPVAPPPAQPTAVSYVGPAVRPGPSIVAYYQRHRLTIDGVFDEWDLEKTTVNQVVLGANRWNGAADASANVMWSWDEDYLYFAARVRDDVYAQRTWEEDLFLGDSLDLLIDTDVASDYYRRTLSGDDYQLGISPGLYQVGADTEAYLWYPADQAGRRRRVLVGATPLEDGYRVEAAIPWTTFDVLAQAGDHFGFAFSVSDNDRPNQAEQQTMVSNVGTRVLTDPTTWGDLTLSGRAAPAPNPNPGPPPTLPPPDHGGGRPGVLLEAGYLTNAPILDGNLSDWSAPRTSVDSIVYGGDQWGGPDDLSGSLQVGWNDTYLYLGVEVIDDQYSQPNRGEDIFLGDSLEILFDADLNGDFNRQSLSGDDFQIGMSPGSPNVGRNPEAYLWFPAGSAGRRSDVWLSASPTGRGYVMEVAFPWTLFGVTPAGGQRFGFAFSISDNDNPSRAVQQTLASNVLTRILTDPTTWGNLILTR